MLNVGIHTGHEKIQTYLKIINQSNIFTVSGIYTLSKLQIRQKGIRIFSTYEELIQECDCILFIGYTKDQFNSLIKALKSSKHVYFDSLDKLEFYEAQELLKLAVEANVVFEIGLKNSFYTGIKNIHKGFENPVLVEIIIHNKLQKDIKVDILNEFIIEFIFQLLKLIKGNVKRIAAKTVSVYNEMSDVANINMEFDNGSIVTFSVNMVSRNRKCEMSFYKHQNISTIDLISKTIKVNRVNHNSFIKKKLLNQYNSKKIELSEFHAAISNEKTSTTSVENGVKTLEIINKIREKIRITSNQV